MHSTEHMQQACSLHPWERKNANRVCERGDSKMLREIKKAANQARRRQDKAEARNY